MREMNLITAQWRTNLSQASGGLWSRRVKASRQARGAKGLVNLGQSPDSSPANRQRLGLSEGRALVPGPASSPLSQAAPQAK